MILEFKWLAIAVVSATCVQAVRPTASYRTLQLGGNAAAVGVVAASYALIAVLLAIPVGAMIDRGEPRRFLAGGVTVLGAGALLSGLSGSIFVLAIAQAILSLGQLSYVLAIQSIVARRSDRERAFARLTVAGGSGQLVGPLLGGWLVGMGVHGSLSGSTRVFFTSALLAGVGLILAFTIPRFPRETSASSVDRTRTMLGALTQGTGLPQVLVTSIAMTTAIEMIVTYLPVLGAGHGIRPEAIGVLLALRATAGLASRMTMTRMMTHVGGRVLILAALAVSSAGVCGIAIATPVWLLALLATTAGFALGIGAPMTMSMVAARAPTGATATTMALRVTGDRIGQFVLALGLGALAAALGPEIVFVALSISLFGNAGLLRLSSALVYES